jgi:hypothetical protein
LANRQDSKNGGGKGRRDRLQPLPVLQAQEIGNVQHRGSVLEHNADPGQQLVALARLGGKGGDLGEALERRFDLAAVLEVELDGPLRKAYGLDAGCLVQEAGLVLGVAHGSTQRGSFVIES